MYPSTPVDGGAMVQSASAEELRRAARWHAVRVVFILLYLGIMFDIFTTYLGFRQMGAAYEQNPIVLYLINRVDWTGLLILITAISILLYASLRIIYQRMSPRWTVAISGTLALLAALRWVVVVVAVYFLARS